MSRTRASARQRRLWHEQTSRDAGCYPWDVCAGAIIVQECGGLASGSPTALARGLSFGDCLMNRRYIFVRAVAVSPGAVMGPPLWSTDVQGDADGRIKRGIARDLYAAVETWETPDMARWLAIAGTPENS